MFSWQKKKLSVVSSRYRLRGLGGETESGRDLGENPFVIVFLFLGILEMIADFQNKATSHCSCELREKEVFNNHKTFTSTTRLFVQWRCSDSIRLENCYRGIPTALGSSSVTVRQGCDSPLPYFKCLLTAFVI